MAASAACAAPVTAVPAPARRASAAAIFVWGVWAALLLAYFGSLIPFHARLPSIDEWHWVPVLTGQQPLTWEALWGPWAEHRVVLPRLTLLALDWALGYNLWAGAVVNIGTMGLLAFALIRAAARDRGHVAYTDACLAILLLRFFPMFTDGWIIHNVEWTAIAGGLLLIVDGAREPLSLGRALLAGGLLLLYPLTGVMGLAMVPALSAWLAWAALKGRFQNPLTPGPSPPIRGKGEPGLTTAPKTPRHSDRWAAVTGLALAAAPAMWLPVYLSGHLKGPGGVPGPLQLLAGATASLITGLGSAAIDLWPISGVVGAGLLLAGVGIVAAAWYRRPGDRIRLAGLVLFLAAVGSLALAIAWGRASLGVSACLARRYGSMTVIIWCCLYLAAGADPSLRAGRWLQALLFAVALGLLPVNTMEAVQTVRRARGAEDALIREVQAGASVDELIDKYQATLLPNWNGAVNPWNVYFVRAGMVALKRAQFGAFSQLREDPRPLDLSPGGPR